MRGVWLLDWEDPEIRVEAFFVNVERDINRLLSESLTEDEALLKYIFRKTTTSDGSVFSDSEFDYNSCGDVSEVDSLFEGDSVGDGAAAVNDLKIFVKTTREQKHSRRSLNSDWRFF